LYISFYKYLFRTFKSILKCQRIQRHKPSSNYYRISSTTNDALRSRRSNSCDISGSHLLTKSESMTSHGTSSDSQRHSTSTKNNRNVVNKARRTSRKESVTNTTIPKSASTPVNTSPWHLRKPVNVR
jgi:hypothetical protein